MTEECEYKRQCPFTPYFLNHGLRCKEDCAMQSTLRFIDEWENRKDGKNETISQ